MRIYTKSGDKGETGLVGGARVSKADPRIAAIGEVDELNAHLGVLLTLGSAPQTAELLLQIQKDLFCIGAELATPDISQIATSPHVSPNSVADLEKEIDLREEPLPLLKNFILPGGTPFAAHTHIARAVCRRAERSVAALSLENKTILIYLNRLSDLLFVIARGDCQRNRVDENIWKP